MDLHRPLVGPRVSSLEVAGHPIRSDSMEARGSQHITSRAQVIEQCELERSAMPTAPPS
jgi:hypothetical protein